MDFSSDPLLAGRNFSYFDTQISRLGVNFGDIPVNRPVCPFMNNLQDGKGQMFSKRHRARYHPNRFDDLPVTKPENGGFKSYPEVVSGIKERMLGPKFNEYTDQATLFYNSMSEPEKAHMVAAAQFELSKCFEKEVISKSIERLNLIDHDFALQVAEIFPDVTVPDAAKPNHGRKSAFLSQVDGKNTFTAEGRKVGIHLLPGYDHSQVAPLAKAFEAAKMMVKYVSPSTGTVKSSSGESVTAEFTFENSRSTHFDAILFIGGTDDKYVKSLKQGRTIHAVREAYMHLKTIGATGNAVEWVEKTCLPGDVSAQGDQGVVLVNGVVLNAAGSESTGFAKAFIDGVAKHRVWDREVSHIAA